MRNLSRPLSMAVLVSLPIAACGDAQQPADEHLKTKIPFGMVDPGQSELGADPTVNAVLAPNADWTAEGNQNGAYFGASVASAGDVNGDGFDDVIVGANGFGNGQTSEGKASLYLGSALGLSATPSWTAEGNQTDAWFGWSVASAGDVNGDGFDDVIVGARFYDNGQTDEGKAFVYLGGAMGLSATPAWTAESDQANAAFGWSVASAGDINGDGFGDVVVGAPLYDGGQTDEGRAFVYLGSATGLGATPAWTAESDQMNAFFGTSVAGARDVNGDGFGEVIIGATSYDNGQSNEGRAYVYLGSAAGLSSIAAWTAESNQANAAFGRSVASAGDVNSDGFGDVIIGSNAYDNGEMDEGRAFVYLGGAMGLAPAAAWTAESNQVGAEFGWSVASAGDINRDGFGDVLVGAHRYDNGQIDEGRAFAYLGSATGLSLTPVWATGSKQANAWFGWAVAKAGDVNADGATDVIIGAYNYDNGQIDEGAAFLFLGGATCGNSVIEGGEGCDDGNVNNGDGCNSDCLIELGKPCAGEDAACASGACNPAGNVCCAPMPEICDSLDNDCDGIVDDGNPGGGAPCSPPYDPMLYPGPRDKGACAPGVLTCKGVTGVACVGGYAPQPEVCDGIDNDCDGSIDETGAAPDGIDGSANPFPPPGTSIGDPCGFTIGVCQQGKYSCFNGLFACFGGKGPSQEICDGLDNDCDGVIDNACIKPCGNGVLEAGEACDDGNPFAGDGCDADCKLELGQPCGLAAGACASGFCVDGVCCDVPSCPVGDQCFEYTCVPQLGVCASQTKPNGTPCNDNDACTKTDTCQLGTCEGRNPVSCSAVDECHEAGTCDPASGQCDNTAKPEGTPCTKGICKAGICASHCSSVEDCPAGNECSDGNCVPTVDNSTPGCACTVVGEKGSSSQTWGMMLVALIAWFRRRRSASNVPRMQ